MPFTGPIEDRLAIRELFGTYADASWRGDRELWADCFTENGCWTSHLFDCKGRAELLATFEDLWKDWETVGFLSEIGSIEVDGNRAAVRSYAREVVLMKSGGIFKLCGRYEDSLVKLDGEWKFARRDYTMTIPELPAGEA